MKNILDVKKMVRTACDKGAPLSLMQVCLLYKANVMAGLDMAYGMSANPRAYDNPKAYKEALTATTLIDKLEEFFSVNSGLPLTENEKEKIVMIMEMIHKHHDNMMKELNLI